MTALLVEQAFAGTTHRTNRRVTPEMAVDFTDDSSSALALSHRATGDLATFKGRGIAKFDAAERAVIEANLRAKREKRVAELVKDGHTIKQARERAQEEYDNPKLGKERRAEERADRHVREVEDLADMHLKPAKHGHGSKSRRKIVAKSGKPICLNCKLEADGCWCICANGGQLCVSCESYRRSQTKRGRPAAGKRSRVVRVRGTVSTPVAAALKGIGVSVGQIVEAFVEAAVTTGVAAPLIVEQLQAS